jgi:hydroxyacylglutathione hydrolase
VDVRKQSEWDEDHIAGAIHLPLSEIGKGAGLDRIPTDRPVVLHCEGGGRSAIAASVLKAAGREDVANLQGGISAWKKAGLPVQKGPMAETLATP